MHSSAFILNLDYMSPSPGPHPLLWDEIPLSPENRGPREGFFPFYFSQIFNLFPQK